MVMKKWVCPVCKYIHESDAPPVRCPVCQTEAERFTEKEDSESEAS